tara:strand:+ start:522 stop:2267 length:1746 start_codon:yes stop_codon:yes gene_type:complete
MSDSMFPPSDVYEAEVARQQAERRGADPRQAERDAAFAAESAKRRENMERYRYRPEEYLAANPGLSDAAKLDYLRATKGDRAAALSTETEFAREQQAAADQGLRDKFELEAFRLGIPESRWSEYVDQRILESKSAPVERPLADAAGGELERQRLKNEQDRMRRGIAEETALARGYLGDLDRIQGESAEIAGLEKDAALYDYRVRAQMAEEESRAKRDYRNEVRDLMQQKQAADKLRKEAKEKASADIDEAINEVSEFKINPNRIFDSLGKRLLSALAQGLGAFAGSDVASKIIEGAINRDIDAQKAQLANKKFGIRLQENAYSRLLDRHGDEEKAELLARQQAYTLVEMKLGEVADKYKVDLSKTGLAKVVANIEKSRLATELSLADKEFAARTAAAQLRARTVKVPKLSEKDKEFFSQFESQFLPQLKAVEDYYYGRGKFQGRGLKDSPMWRQTTGMLPQDIGRMMGTDSAEFYELAANLSKTFSEIKEGGKISDHDLKFYLERVPLPTDSNSMIEFKLQQLSALGQAAAEYRKGSLSDSELQTVIRAGKRAFGESNATASAELSKEIMSRMERYKGQGQ